MLTNLIFYIITFNLPELKQKKKTIYFKPFKMFYINLT